MKFTIKKSIIITIVLAGFLVSFFVGKTISPSYYVERISLDVFTENNQSFYMYKDKKTAIEKIVPLTESYLYEFNSNQVNHDHDYLDEIVEEKNTLEDSGFWLLKLKKHYKFWSLLPALITLLLCWLTREPITSLLSGIISGALILGQYNIMQDVLIPNLMSKNSASMIIIYLFLLGGLLGIWSKTGAAQSFANWMTVKFVKGPRSAKLVAWFLGVLFFQGGTMSVVLVGSTVKPIADKENVSHEELAYIVDSTASPIASQLAFNAWPAYVQAFIYISGVGFLATEADRIAFFFKSVPFCFYAIFAVLGTFLLSIEKPFFLGEKLKKAMMRARTTGKLDAKYAVPLSSPELEKSKVPAGYNSHVLEFIIPLISLIGIAIGSFIVSGSPDIIFAFTCALLIAFCIAIIKGMGVLELIVGVVDGMKSLVLGLIILLCAMFIGQMTIQTGAGIYLTQLLGTQLPYWILPVLLLLISVCIAFSTGTSWGTYAVVFPIAMPLSWSIAIHAGVSNPELFLTLCFAAVMDGAVFGDQCSPISDTTVLSAMCTGCDLMDHVKTQLPQALVAASLAAICWTVVTLLFV
jgi:Na+/H+ antiporter NhaC